MLKSHRYLTASVLLSCSCLLAPFYAHAEENVVEPGLHIKERFDTFTVSDQINVSTDNGIGVLVSAPGNTLNIESDVTASGTNGTAVQFEGGQQNSDGSVTPIDVTILNVSGSLAGKKAAIYISPDVYVDEIRIMNGANLQGNIISDWNPVPSDTPELIFGAKINSDGARVQDKDFNLSYSGNIDSKSGIYMRVLGGTLEYNGTANVKSVDIAAGAILSGTGKYILTEKTLANNEIARGTLYNMGTFDLGEGVETVTIKGNYRQTDGKLLVDFDSDGHSDALVISEGTAFITNGKIILTPQVDYYFNGQTIKLNPIIQYANKQALEDVSALPDINNISPVLEFTVAADGTIIKENNKEYVCNYKNTQYIIKVERVDNGYQNVADDKISAGIGSAIDNDTEKQKEDPLYIISDAKKELLNALDNPIVPTNLTGDERDKYAKKVINTNLKKLNPNVVSSQAQAVVDTHATLNNLVSVTSLVNVGSMSTNIPAPRLGGGLGPAAQPTPKYNSWRNIVMPFSGYTDQHNGSNGYTNHNSGVIGAIERTFANGLTHGYHAALNHQSTSDSGSTVKGEGLYFGAHASYAPADWNGWSVFGSARLGVEQMRSHRNVAILGTGGLYTGRVDSDWTGFSGSLNLGTALTKEHGVLISGPFAALDYSFVHRPSVTETGAAYRAHLDGATYDSLRTQLGYRLVTKPKPLDSYDSTQWQAHASVAWNHELLNDNGTTTYQLVEFPGTTIEDDVETYGRDSMSIAAGVIFKTPNRLDVGLTLGSDIYRKGGSSIYGKVNFEWKF